MSPRLAWLGLLGALFGPVDEPRLGCGFDGSGDIRDQDGDGAGSGIDCDDRDPLRSPQFLETCNGIDDDCDDEIDEGFDLDEDGWNDALACPRRGRDCDDGDSQLHPDASETCDGIDNNCNGRVDEDPLDGTWLWRDADGDGWGDAHTPGLVCAGTDGWVDRDGDCDDSNADIYPDRWEICDGLDNDCDGEADEGVPTDAFRLYEDADGDGFGYSWTDTKACTVLEGYSDNSRDCDDDDPSVHPDATEICDGVDNDCDRDTDGGVDEGTPGSKAGYSDGDGDGWGSAENPGWYCYGAPGWSPRPGDCDDEDDGINPGVRDGCDYIDNDCDRIVDGDPDTWILDSAGDGWGDERVEWAPCDPDDGWVEERYAGDCDDENPLANPSLGEFLGSGDSNCDGVETETPAAHCQDWLDAGLSGGDGLYLIDPDGLDGDIPTQDVHCDMNTDGGGWTMVQRTVWDWDDSGQLLTDYATWYGDTVGDPGVGWAYRLEGRAWEALMEDGEILAVHHPRDADSGADCDPLAYIGTRGTLTVDADGASLTRLLSPVEIISETTLSATDMGDYTWCTGGHNLGVPWFYGLCCKTCPTYKGSAWDDDPHPMAEYLDTTRDEHGNRVYDVCPSGDAQRSYGGAGAYEGVNVMEVYLR